MHVVHEVEIVVNGHREKVPAGSTLFALIDRFEERDTHLIVQRNGRCVYPAHHATTTVEPGDRIEFIHPAFGG